MARSRASISAWISMNLLRARSAVSRTKGAASTYACASLSSIMRSRAFFRVSSRSLIRPLLENCLDPSPGSPINENAANEHPSTAATDVLQLRCGFGLFPHERVLVGSTGPIVLRSSGLFFLRRKRGIVAGEASARAFDRAVVRSCRDSALRQCAKYQSGKHQCGEKRSPADPVDQTKSSHTRSCSVGGSAGDPQSPVDANGKAVMARLYASLPRIASFKGYAVLGRRFSA